MKKFLINILLFFLVSVYCLPVLALETYCPGSSVKIGKHGGWKPPEWVCVFAFNPMTGEETEIGLRINKFYRHEEMGRFKPGACVKLDGLFASLKAVDFATPTKLYTTVYAADRRSDGGAGLANLTLDDMPPADERYGATSNMNPCKGLCSQNIDGLRSTPDEKLPDGCYWKCVQIGKNEKMNIRYDKICNGLKYDPLTGKPFPAE